MALNTNTSIVPVGVSGAFSFKPKNRWWAKPVNIAVNIGDVIDINTHKDLGVDGLKELVEQKLRQLSGEINEYK